METARGIAEVNGTRLYYEVAGAGEPLALLHGFGLDLRMWDDQVAAFARRYRVLRHDARGFGRSDPPGGVPYSRAADLKALLEYLGLGPAHVLGLSMGGGNAIDFALAYPEMTRTLIPVDSTLDGYRWPHGGMDGYRAAAARARAGDLAGAKERWLADPFFAPACERPAVAARLHAMMADDSGWHWRNADPHLSAGTPALARLGKIAAPALIVVGERDVHDCQAIAALLQAGISHARMVVLPGAGHMSPLEDPAAFNAAVLEFLAG